MSFTEQAGRLAGRTEPKQVGLPMSVARRRGLLPKHASRRPGHAGPGYDRAVARSSDTRESARLEMPEPMRRDVRLLGEVLGQVIVESGGGDLLADVERLRRAGLSAPARAGHHPEAGRVAAGRAQGRGGEGAAGPPLSL